AGRGDLRGRGVPAGAAGDLGRVGAGGAGAADRARGSAAGGARARGREGGAGGVVPVARGGNAAPPIWTPSSWPFPGPVGPGSPAPRGRGDAVLTSAAIGDRAA